MQMWKQPKCPSVDEIVNIHTHIRLLIYNKGTKNTYGERIISLINGVRKLDSHVQKKETGPLSYIIHKNQLKMD